MRVTGKQDHYLLVIDSLPPLTHFGRYLAVGGVSDYTSPTGAAQWNDLTVGAGNFVASGYGGILQFQYNGLGSRRGGLFDTARCSGQLAVRVAPMHPVAADVWRCGHYPIPPCRTMKWALHQPENQRMHVTMMLEGGGPAESAENDIYSPILFPGHVYTAITPELYTFVCSGSFRVFTVSMPWFEVSGLALIDCGSLVVQPSVIGVVISNSQFLAIPAAFGRGPAISFGLSTRVMVQDCIFVDHRGVLSLSNEKGAAIQAQLADVTILRSTFTRCCELLAWPCSRTRSGH